MKHLYLLFTSLSLLALHAYAQEPENAYDFIEDREVVNPTSRDTARKEEPVVRLYGFGGIYYAYDFLKPEDHHRPSFNKSYGRHNEVAVNQTLIGIRVTHSLFRAGLGLQTGSYVQNYYEDEPSTLKNIFEAFGGVRILQGLWLDAGVFESHIGLEAPMGFENWSLSHNIMADNTPYYLSGARLGYQFNEKWYIAGFFLNGWLTIESQRDNKALGTQVQYKPTKRWLINSSTFFGTEKPAIDRLNSAKDSAYAGNRYFHSFYAVYEGRRWSWNFMQDFGLQRFRAYDNQLKPWWSVASMLRFRANKEIFLCARGELYNDQYGAIVSYPFSPALGVNNYTNPNDWHAKNPAGFRVVDFSGNIDWQPHKNVKLRFEAREYLAADPILITGNGVAKRSNLVLATAIEFKF